MEIKRKGLTLNVFRSECINPRDNENLGTMICFHKRYTLGDKHKFKDSKEFIDYLKEYISDIAVILPLYLYDHSGLSISTTEFFNKMDSGKVGYIFVTKEKLKYYGMQDFSEEHLKEILKNEVRTYDKYLSGEIQTYAFKITNPDDETIEYIDGFEVENGNYKRLLKDMKQSTLDEYSFLFDSLSKNQECYL